MISIWMLFVWMSLGPTPDIRVGQFPDLASCEGIRSQVQEAYTEVKAISSCIEIKPTWFRTSKDQKHNPRILG